MTDDLERAFVERVRCNVYRCTVSTYTCALRHRKHGEGRMRVAARFPTCGACSEGKARAERLAQLGWAPTLNELRNSLHRARRQERAAATRWYREHVIA